MSSDNAPSNARFSTYSGAPSIQPSLAATFNTTPSARGSTAPLNEKRMSAAPNSAESLSSSDPKAADLQQWSGALERMNDERLEKQRYVMNASKSDEVAKLALGAKVERALARRMVGQDASFSVKKSEKRNLEVEAR